MTSRTAPSAQPATVPARPSLPRRAAVAVTGLLAAALPLAWGVSSLVEVVTRQQREHLFHQLTGQGLLLYGLWLGSLVPLVAAGWRGARPGPAAGCAHAAVVGGAVVAGALAPGNADALLAGIVLLTGALLWAALPRRPRLTAAAPDPVLAPVALAAAALLLPFALGQAGLQRAFADEHARMGHYFDMAWLALALGLLAVAAALVPAVRRLAGVAMLATLALGAARWALTTDRTWSMIAVGLGVLGVVATVARLRVRVE